MVIGGERTTKKEHDIFSVCAASHHFLACVVDGKTTVVISPAA